MPRLGGVLAVVAVALLAAGCSGGSDGSSSSEADRQAGLITRGTEVCISNTSSDQLNIQIVRSGPGYDNTNGEALGAGSTRCMDSDSYGASGAATARVTIASGEVFSVQGFNPPADPPWIGINGDARQLSVNQQTDFKIGIHPIVAERISDTSDDVRFTVTIR